jgi:CHAT domain-containing protein/Tfp pilus assembly protein PilF
MYRLLVLIPLSLGLITPAFTGPGPSIDQIHAKLTRADSLFSIERYEESYRLYEEALESATEREHKELMAYSLKGLGNIWYLYGDLESATQHYQDALVLFKGLGDLRGELKIYNNLGIIDEEKLQYAQALEHYRRALAILEVSGYTDTEDRQDKSALLGNIGHLYEVQTELDSAIYYYGNSRAVAGEIGYARGEADALHNIGNVYQRLSEYDSARVYYERSMAIFEGMENRKGVADNLREMGATERKRGQYGDAIAFLERAVDLFGEMRKEGAVRGEVEALNALGLVYQEIGKQERAIEYFMRAVTWYRFTGDSIGIALALENLGMAYFELIPEGQVYADSALAYYEMSIAIFQKAGKKREEADGFNNKGLVYQRIGMLDDALSSFTNALAVYREAGNQIGQATAHSNIANLFMIKQDHIQALEHYEKAISLIEKETQPVLMATSLASLGIAYRSKGENKKAVQALRSAVRIVEDIRGQLVTQEFKSAFIEDKVRIYEELIDLLLQQGSVEEAFHYVERAKARALLDLVGGKSVSVKKVPSDIQALIEEEQTLLRKMELLDDEEKKGEVFVAYQEVLAKLEARYPEYVTLKIVEPVDLRIIQKNLDSKTIILEYFLCHRGVYLFAVDNKGVSAQKLHLSPEELYEDVTKFRLYILDNNLWQPYALKLYEKLVQAVEDELAHKERVCIVPHGILHHLPFSALLVKLEPQQFFVETHDILYVPSSSILDIAQSKNTKRRKSSLIMAKSDFSDHPGWRDLDGTIKEKNLLVENDLLPGAVAYEDREATEDRLKEIAGRYDFLHLATHGQLNQENPLHSRILLSVSEKNDGSLTVGEIFGLDLSAYLVTLSACETGEIGSYVAGKEFSSGDDLVGLTRAFIYAGTPSVVATLWFVADDPTAIVMEQFYRNLQKHDKAHALCEAQRYMIKESYYPPPFYWAAFVLFGDWE